MVGGGPRGQKVSCNQVRDCPPLGSEPTGLGSTAGASSSQSIAIPGCRLCRLFRRPAGVCVGSQPPQPRGYRPAPTSYGLGRGRGGEGRKIGGKRTSPPPPCRSVQLRREGAGSEVLRPIDEMDLSSRTSAPTEINDAVDMVGRGCRLRTQSLRSSRLLSAARRS